MVAFLVGVFSIIFSIIANKRSKEANKISQEALQLSKDINKRNLENISIEGPGNPIVLKRSVKIDYKNNENADYNDYYLILNMRINNHSYQTVTVNELYAHIRKKDDDIFQTVDKVVRF